MRARGLWARRGFLSASGLDYFLMFAFCAVTASLAFILCRFIHERCLSLREAQRIEQDINRLHRLSAAGEKTWRLRFDRRKNLNHEVFVDFGAGD